MRDGQMISNSIIVDPSDTVMVEMMGNFKASFETLVSADKATTGDVLKLATTVLEMADKTQIKMSDFGYKALQQSVDFMKAQIEQGKYVMDFAGQAIGQSYDLAGKVVTSNSDTVDKAFSLLGDVKTGDFADTLKALSSYIMIFALGAIYLAGRRR